MELRILIFLTVFSTSVLLCQSATDDVVSSGDDESDPSDVSTTKKPVVTTKFTTTIKPQTTKADNGNSDITIEGSGTLKPGDTQTDDHGDDDDDGILNAEGSGSSSTATAPIGIMTLAPHKNVRCDDRTLKCWCVSDDGTAIAGTERYNKKRQMDCVKYGLSISTSLSPLPTRGKEETGQPNEEVTIKVESSDVDDTLIFVDEETTTAVPRRRTDRITNPPRIVTYKPTIEPISLFNNDPGFDNKIPEKKTTKPPKVGIDEREEELTNEISGADSQKHQAAAVKRHEVKTGLFISHPGILAAIIGGGVVALLCFILLVMFIVYRMRKKDEGSYPLNDSKPFKNYPYDKAPSREFYA